MKKIGLARTCRSLWDFGDQLVLPVWNARRRGCSVVPKKKREAEFYANYPLSVNFSLYIFHIESQRFKEKKTINKLNKHEIFCVGFGFEIFQLLCQKTRLVSIDGTKETNREEPFQRFAPFIFCCCCLLLCLI